MGRFGVGMGVRLTDAVHFNIELNGNFLSDRFNSKKGSAVDWQLGALAGFTFKIGLKKEKAPEEVPVEPSPAPAPVSEAEPAAEAEPAPAPVIEAAAFEPVTENVFFRLNESELLDDERAKVLEIAAVLKAKGP